MRHVAPRPPSEPPATRNTPNADPDLSVPEWVRRELSFHPDPSQERVLSPSIRCGLLNCCRQWGKSTVTAAKAVHHACHQPGSLTLAVSPSARQSAEFLRKAAAFARRLGIHPQGDGDNRISLEFPNAARIVGLPGAEATVRGFSAVSLLLVDEASRVPDDLYLALRPMLAVGNGALWLMSTPFGARGFFWDAWERGGPEWERIRVPATACPRISPAFLGSERRAMSGRWFRQEYLCEFEDSAGAVFSRGLVQRAITSDVEPLVIE